MDGYRDPQDDTQTQRRRGSATPWLLLVVVLAAFGAAGYYGHGAYMREVETRARAEAEKAALEARIAELDATRAQQAERLKALEAQGAQLVTEKQSLEAAVQERDAKLAELQATQGQLEERLKEEIAQGDVKLTEKEGKLHVELVDKVLFDSGSAELSARGQEVLTRVGSVLKGVEGRAIQVSGHTDDAPPTEKLRAVFPTNWELSVARAVNVVRFLAEKGGVPQRRMVATGHGEWHPQASNATPAGRARNRRIELLLTPDAVQAVAAAVRVPGVATPIVRMATGGATKAPVKPVKGTVQKAPVRK